MPPGAVTVISAGPGPPGGVTATIRVSEYARKDLAGTPPMVTPVARARPVPVSTTVLPPVTGPVAGLTRLTDGAAV